MEPLRWLYVLLTLLLTQGEFIPVHCMFHPLTDATQKASGDRRCGPISQFANRSSDRGLFSQWLLESRARLLDSHALSDHALLLDQYDLPKSSKEMRSCFSLCTLSHGSSQLPKNPPQNTSLMLAPAPLPVPNSRSRRSAPVSRRRRSLTHRKWDNLMAMLDELSEWPPKKSRVSNTSSDSTLLKSEKIEYERPVAIVSGTSDRRRMFSVKFKEMTQWDNATTPYGSERGHLKRLALNENDDEPFEGTSELVEISVARRKKGHSSNVTGKDSPGLHDKKDIAKILTKLTKRTKISSTNGREKEIYEEQEDKSNNYKKVGKALRKRTKSKQLQEASELLQSEDNKGQEWQRKTSIQKLPKIEMLGQSQGLLPKCLPKESDTPRGRHPRFKAEDINQNTLFKRKGEHKARVRFKAKTKSSQREKDTPTPTIQSRHKGANANKKRDENWDDVSDSTRPLDHYTDLREVEAWDQVPRSTSRPKYSVIESPAAPSPISLNNSMFLLIIIILMVIWMWIIMLHFTTALHCSHIETPR